MRRYWILILGLAAVAPADTIIDLTGRVQPARVLEVVVATADGGRRVVPAAQMAAVRLATDRAPRDLAAVARMLRFALARARKFDDVVVMLPSSRPAVYVGYGVFAPSALAVVRRLEEAGTSPRLLFAPDMREDNLARVHTLIVPGGWAPAMRDALGAAGLAAVRKYVEGGGRYLGICAGAYLPCDSVVWEGVSYDYPLDLAPGHAIGPLANIAPWPQSASVVLKAESGSQRVLYAGGAHFKIKGATVLARYPDQTAASVLVKSGRGRLLLTGAHPEFRAARDRDLLDENGWAQGVNPGDGKTFARLLAAFDR